MPSSSMFHDPISYYMLLYSFLLFDVMYTCRLTLIRIYVCIMATSLNAAIDAYMYVALAWVYQTTW